ncbi:MAG TPA: TetR/AcrR family transcriptional regulator [Methylomirabilota bacterium]|nr:TetR/AcrR family transcriptional regulator [Methylomirabilota bacterium]
MSRGRTRPTRDATRERLFAAAAEVFEQQGIGGASIEAIAAAAGFTRGAVYSNFASKDDLIIAMLEDHVDRSVRHHLNLLERHRDPVDFVAALRESDRGRQDPLGRSPLLHMELILYVARSEQRRPELAKRLRARRALVADIIAATNRAAGRGQVVDPAWAGPMLLALEDGFRLHRLIDPDTTPADSFVRAVSELQRLIGLGGPSPQRSRRQGSRAVRGSGKAR